MRTLGFEPMSILGGGGGPPPPPSYRSLLKPPFRVTVRDSGPKRKKGWIPVNSGSWRYLSWLLYIYIEQCIILLYMIWWVMRFTMYVYIYMSFFIYSNINVYWLLNLLKFQFLCNLSPPSELFSSGPPWFPALDTGMLHPQSPVAWL